MNEHTNGKQSFRYICLGLSAFLACSTLFPYTQVYAEEKQEDMSRIYTAADVNEDFHAAPVYDAQTNTLTLPQIEGYDVEIFGSDNLATIGLDGTVSRPLQDQKVKLLYKITNRENHESITTETNAEIIIPAEENMVDGSNAKPKVIPELREWDGGEGTINLTTARVVVQDEAFAQAAATFASDYEEMTGRPIEIVADAQPQAGDILFARSAQQMLGEEGYVLNIGGEDADADYAEIEAVDHDGALYGGVSILQMLKQDEGMNDLPRGLIRDYPKFKQRGMMFDVARKYIPMEYLNDLSIQM